ncbi:aldehyde oxidase GLOX-like [Rhododendron vialii]|uniref:aldehyde oxidase GLOX-like n=1 Tax=Rhododendron vialii TaxID=182163 RepID=UPI00265F7603|nr:aldehyde oxidase GLOX-like [Rhododendron vialii]
MAALIYLCLQFLCFAFAIIGTRAQCPPGTWELLVENAGIASMHTAVTRWNTVVLLDRTGIGLSNISLPNGECRDDPTDLALTHDCSAHSVLLNLDDNSIRPLEILTDTWCSSGQFLPDGTLLQSGGNDDGTTKFRTFTPCASTCSCDWVELQNITLSQGRWYATNQILPDGSIIIVGGIGISSVEYFPPRPGGAVNFPFLAESGDNQTDNLYPYVHLLPQGNLFIFANNQSVLYDYNENVIVTFFPQLPGGPRNYPSAGSSVMLALEGNYSTATIVICGGAQYGAYLNQSLGIASSVNSTANGSCGRIVATDPNPAWEMEDMPLVRIMGDMVMLPTGDILIINGAQAGSQGFGFATNACLTPVLYQPDQPEGSRFMMLNPGSIPRMYHSTANLLPDGRILITGSNTNYYYTFTGDFPTELRVEAFSPDYLSADNSNLRPVLVKTPQMVQYGNLYNVYLTVPSSLAGILEVNFASAPFTTHSFSQGQRLVKLNITRNVSQVNGQYRIVFQAPPNGMVAPPGYYMMFVVNQGVPSVAHWVQLTS